ncbi:MAG: DUF1800 domain-containing protein [Mucilaginibacter polytrichastri]|nr:DUF1800 domain-containing protein [Mucilaginibacter polytrichastri]
MALKAFSGNFGKSELSHLLRRSLFGVRRSELEQLSGKSLNEVLDILLAPQVQPAPPVNNYYENTPDEQIPAGETWVNATNVSKVNSARISSLKSWWMGRIIHRGVSLQEKMALFMHNHFATETGTVDEARYLYKHYALLRQYALGNFRELVRQVTIDPGMLKYLNGYLNGKNAPDENYARELQELFVIGKGPNSKYTEEDVRTMARVLTGYRIEPETINSYFDPNNHDIKDKSFSGFYANTVIRGRSGADGEKELDDLLDMLFANPEAALFICRKLYRFFGYYNITDDVEKDVIAPLAAVFRESKYEIAPVLRAFLGSEHFYSIETRSCHIKSPVDLCAGLCIEFETAFPADADYVAQYALFGQIRNQAANMQQNIGSPPDVSGWPAYYQIPQFHELWINSDTLPKRISFVDQMIGGGFGSEDARVKIDPIAYTEQFPEVEDPNKLIDAVLAHLYVIEVSDEVKTFLKSILLSNQTDDKYWGQAWRSYKINPSDMATRNIVLSHLQSFYRYILDLEEYQLS